MSEGFEAVVPPVSTTGRPYVAVDLEEWRELEAERALLRAEVTRLLDRQADMLAEQTNLRSMSASEGIAELDLAPPREIVLAWVHAARGMLGDAVNYSETRIDFPGVSMEVGVAGEERYILTVQRAGKVTPHQARMAAEEKVAAVRALAKDAMKLPTAEDPRPADDRVSPRAILQALGEWS